jgi:hypothetical protein
MKLLHEIRSEIHKHPSNDVEVRIHPETLSELLSVSSILTCFPLGISPDHLRIAGKPLIVDATVSNWTVAPPPHVHKWKIVDHLLSDPPKHRMACVECGESRVITLWERTGESRVITLWERSE